MYFSKLTSFLAVLAVSIMLVQAAPAFDDSDMGMEAHEFDEGVQLEARWGSGHFRVDDDTYHRELKPQIIKAFWQRDSKFSSKCGSNPDFIVDKNGNVWPEPQAKYVKACPRSKYMLNLADLISQYQ